MKGTTRTYPKKLVEVFKKNCSRLEKHKKQMINAFATSSKNITHGGGGKEGEEGLLSDRLKGEMGRPVNLFSNT